MQSLYKPNSSSTASQNVLLLFYNNLITNSAVTHNITA